MKLTPRRIKPLGFNSKKITKDKNLEFKILWKNVLRIFFTYVFSTSCKSKSKWLLIGMTRVASEIFSWRTQKFNSKSNFFFKFWMKFSASLWRVKFFWFKFHPNLHFTVLRKIIHEIVNQIPRMKHRKL